VVRDPVTLNITQGAYSESGPGWTDFGYKAGNGNFPLWESDLLRPEFRKLFKDWHNPDAIPDYRFPDLGDATSNDPNDTAGLTWDATIPNLATPFDPSPALAPASGHTIIVSGTQTLTYTESNAMIKSIKGNGIGNRDSLIIKCRRNCYHYRQCRRWRAS